MADALEIARERKMRSDWPILTKLRCKLLRACLKKLNLEKLTVRLGLTVVYFPIFRQARLTRKQLVSRRCEK